ncbi:hypothetical protein GCM10009682_25650 [Luedemannella flava]|uniref:Uncharacterized protein n=1 Tax=Luedemannella flava TaxID=349316 RepID=A0ABN2LXW0_9ACTN
MTRTASTPTERGAEPMARRPTVLLPPPAIAPPQVADRVPRPTTHRPGRRNGGHIGSNAL